MTAHVTIPAETQRPPTAKLEWPMLALIAALAGYLHAVCWSTVPPDMPIFLFPWYEHILQQGPVRSFAEPFGNYTPPYLYLLAAGSLADGVLAPLSVIKWLSVIGTAFLAFSVADLLKACGADPKRAAFVFLLPTVILSAGLLGQCDALWAGACVFAVAAMVRGRTVASLIWCGIAIAFKAQAAFIAPFIIGALIGRRAPFWQWPLPALVYAGMMLPAWVVGWPAADLALVYVRQAEHFLFPGNLANPWVWATVFAKPEAPAFYWIGYCAAGMAAVAVGALAAQSVRRPRAMLWIALLSAMVLPFLLPKMHERYLFLADVLALSLALVARDRTSIVIAATVQLTSLAALVSYIYNWPVPALVGAFIGAAAVVAICKECVASGARLFWSRRAIARS